MDERPAFSTKPSSFTLSLQRPCTFIRKCKNDFSLGLSLSSGNTLTVYTVSPEVTERTGPSGPAFETEPVGSATLKPFAESVTCSQPSGKPAGGFSTGAASPAAHEAISRNFLAQLSGATLAHVRSRASRAHSSAARTWSPQPAGGGSYLPQLRRQLSTAVLPHLLTNLSHLAWQIDRIEATGAGGGGGALAAGGFSCVSGAGGGALAGALLDSALASGAAGGASTAFGVSAHAAIHTATAANP